MDKSIQNVMIYCSLVSIILIPSFSIFVQNMDYFTYQKIGHRSNIELSRHNFEYIGEYIMSIESDSDFISYGFPGNGTLINPYRIENYLIGGDGVVTALYITNVTKHFIVNSCLIMGNYPILIDNIQNVHFNITNCDILNVLTFYPIDVKVGVKLINCGNIRFVNNTIESSYIGLELVSTFNMVVEQNTILGKSTDDSSLKFTGIRVKNTENCSFSQNNFSKGGFSFDISFEQFQSININENTINGRSIIYYFNESDIISTSLNCGQIILFNCTKITIRDYLFTEVYEGIGLYYSESCCIINNRFFDCSSGIYDYSSYGTLICDNLCQGNEFGVYSSYTKYSIIRNNTCINSDYYNGIQIEHTENILIENNNCTSNVLGSGIYDSGFNSTIINNHCYGNINGIKTWLSNNPRIMNNEIYNNSLGILVQSSFDVNIYNNSITFNTQDGGISVINCIGGIISYNLILENVDYGICLNYGTMNFKIHHNSFYNNLIGVEASSQACDDGMNNYWYNLDTLIGNFWSDRGISKTYKIDGDAESLDLYPLKDPIIVPNFEYAYKSNFLLSLPLMFLFMICLNLIKKKRKLSDLSFKKID